MRLKVRDLKFKVISTINLWDEILIIKTKDFNELNLNSELMKENQFLTLTEFLKINKILNNLNKFGMNLLILEDKKWINKFLKSKIMI
jgi:hypothetical protein